MRSKRWIPVVLVLALAAVAVALLSGWRGRASAPAYRSAEVQRGDLRVAVSATGTLNPVTTVQVGSQISGTIAALHADFNSKVREGAILAELDPTFLRAQVAQNEADLERALVALRQAERDLARLTPLRAEGLASQADLDAAETALDAARASVKGAEAALARAETNLRYATIRSPIDGIVISRSVDVGQTVAASLAAPELFSIANDLKRMQLEAWVDEADIGRVAVGQPATFTVDAFPEMTFRGAVEQIRLAPRSEQNVVSYTVVVRVDNPEEKLMPGMTANVSFVVGEARGALKVPTAALRFRPPGAAPERGVRQAGPGGAPARGARQPGPGAAPERGAGPGGPGAAVAGPGEAAGPSAAAVGREEPASGPGGPASRQPQPGGVYLLGPGGSLRRVTVTPGLSDGMMTAVVSDSLAEGDRVVIGSIGGGNGGQGTVNPFAPGGMRGGRR